MLCFQLHNQPEGYDAKLALCCMAPHATVAWHGAAGTSSTETCTAMQVHQTK